MPIPGEFQSPVCAETMAITAGIAAARIMRHGIAAHTSSVAKPCRNAVGAAEARRVLQIAKNIAVNTPVATSAHIPRITSRIRDIPLVRGKAVAGRELGYKLPSPRFARIFGGPLQSLAAQDSPLAHRFANNGSKLSPRRLRAHRRDKDRG